MPTTMKFILKNMSLEVHAMTLIFFNHLVELCSVTPLGGLGFFIRRLDFSVNYFEVEVVRFFFLH